MNSENIKKVTNQAIEQLITALNQGRSETLGGAGVVIASSPGIAYRRSQPNRTRPSQ